MLLAIVAVLGISNGLMLSGMAVLNCISFSIMRVISYLVWFQDIFVLRNVNSIEDRV